MLRKVTKSVFIISVMSSFVFAMTGCSNSQPTEDLGSASRDTTVSAVDKSDQESGGAPAIIMDTTPIEPTKVFDNLYFVGTKGVGAWVVNTSEGIILIDSMNNSDDAKNTIVPGIEKLGLNPADIKYVLVTHGHGDHYGGSQYIADQYGSTILMTAVDWEYMNTHFTYQCGPEYDKPTSHTDITDGQKLTLGDETITIVSTPGHSLGGVSLIIPVTDNGTEHMVGMWGGTGLPKSLEENQTYLDSLAYFAELTDEAQVDVEITAHSAVDNSAERMETLRNRKEGDQNPFVLGQDGYKDYMDKMTAKVVANIEKISID